MSRQPIEEIITDWLVDDAPGPFPSHRFRAALDDARSSRQQWRPRLPTSTGNSRTSPATAAAAIGVVAIVALTLGAWFSGRTDLGAGNPTATLGASATLKPSPAVRAIGTRFGAGHIGAGTYRYVAFDPVFTFTVPEGTRLWVEPTSADAAPFSDSRDINRLVDEGLDVVLAYRPWVDACNLGAGREVPVSQPVDDVLQWLRSQPALSVGASTSVRMGSVIATRVDVEAGAECAATPAEAYGIAPSERAFVFAAGSVHRIFVVDVGDRTAVVDVFANGNHADEWLTAADSIVSSVRFEP